MSSVKKIAGVALLVAASFHSVPSHAKIRSFNEVNQAIQDSQLQTLPARSTVSPLSVGYALLRTATEGVEWVKAHAKPDSFIGRIVATLSSNDDFKADDKTKYIHAMGVCAPAEWKIDHSSQRLGERLGDEDAATGLFAPSSHAVPAIVRISTAVETATYRPGQKRAWGLGIKLFPSANPATPVETRNILFFDQYGLDGNSRPLVLQPPAGRTVQFVNFINNDRIQSFAAGTISTLFSYFDLLAGYRPLDNAAGVDADGLPVLNPVVPTYLVLRAQPSTGINPHVFPGFDFREELRAYADGGIVFDILVSGSKVQDFHPISTDAMTRSVEALHRNLNNLDSPSGPPVIGSLTLGKPVVSTDCDLRLHFGHDPTSAHP